MIGMVVLAILAGLTIGSALVISGASFWLVLAAYSGTGALLIFTTVAFRLVADMFADLEPKDEIAVLNESSVPGRQY